MIINNNPQPKSSFLSVEKDLDLIIDMFFKNPRLKKLLYYTSKDALSRPSLTEDQTLDLLKNNIKLIPKLSIDKEVLNYLVISFNDFYPNSTNPQFRDNIVEFCIVCHMDQWQLNDFQLRPYRIAAEIDSMFNGKHLTGIGTFQFYSGKRLILNEEFAGICVKYLAVHGEEDKKPMPNPYEQEQFEKDFNEMMYGI